MPEDEDEAEDKISASRTVWLRGLNITDGNNRALRYMHRAVKIAPSPPTTFVRTDTVTPTAPDFTQGL